MRSPVPPELEFHTDPVLRFWQSPLCRLVINTDHNIALLAAMIDGNAGTAIFETFLNFAFPELADELLSPTLVVCVIKQLPDIQYSGMVIKGHIQAGDMETLILGEEAKERDKVSAAIFFESPASLAGHVQTDPHTGITVIENGNASEVKAVPVTVPPLLHGGPCCILHMEQSDPVPGIFFFAAYCEPIKQNDIFGDSVFHHFLPLLCRQYPPVSPGGLRKAATFPV